MIRKPKKLRRLQLKVKERRKVLKLKMELLMEIILEKLLMVQEMKMKNS